MNINLLSTLFLCLLILTYCNPSSHKNITQVADDKIYRINVDSTLEYIDLKLTDIADSFEIVALETTQNSIVNANDFYIGEKYIIAFSSNGIFKFSTSGKFLKKIIGWGRGPDEISGFIFAYFYDKNNDLLYLNDYNLNKKLLVYDLDSEKFVAPITKAIQGSLRTFALFNDSLIIGTSPRYAAKTYSIFFQTLQGKFITGIPNVKEVLMASNPVPTYQDSYLSIANNEYRISFEFDDTLFTLKDNHLVPFVILEFKKPREKPPNAKAQKGDRLTHFPRIESRGFLIIGVTEIEEITWITSNAGKSKDNRKYILLNKTTGTHKLIRTYIDDFTGQIQSPGENTIKFPIFLNNGKIVVMYQPKIIKEIAEKGYNNPLLTPNLKESLQEINKTIQETDNPVLLIGKIKDKIY